MSGFNLLRDELLLKLSPTGWIGFEGLMATALSALTKEKIFLAKGGWQGGSDGSSDSIGASIAFEAKRYSSARGLDDRALLGELEELAQATEYRPEIWLIAATVPVAAQTRTKLSRSGRSKGIHVPIVDWAPADCPSLLLFLATAKNHVVTWLDTHHPAHPARDLLISTVDRIIEMPTFAQESKKLSHTLLPAYASFALAKTAVSQAYLSGFKDRHEARRLFRQGITPDAPGVVNLRRSKITDQITSAVRKANLERGITVVLGDEGVGKTWATVQTWREHFSEDMCVLFSSGHIESFQSASATYGIAHIIRSATKTYDIDSKSWEARVSVWHSMPRSDRRLFVIIDGLNERPSVAWLDFIPAMTRLVQDIGGSVVLTCRPRFWSSRIAGALNEKIVQAQIGPLDQNEVLEFLARHNRGPGDIPPSLLPHLGNPRVLTVAVDLLDELGGHDLTLDRLHWAYWKHHWRKRPDATLTDDEFREILANHARQAKFELDQEGKAKVQNPRFLFSRWMEYAAIGARANYKTLADVFWDVAEGRFLVPAETGASEAYAFRHEAFSFAVALRLAYEVLDDPRVIDNELNADQALARAIEPIEAFDRTANILIAVVAVACLHPRSSLGLQRAAIRAFLRLQNQDESMQDDFCAYIREAPNAYVGVAQALIEEHENAPPLLIRALKVGLRRDESREVIEAAIHAWLLDQAPTDEFGSIARSWAEQVLAAEQ